MGKIRTKLIGLEEVEKKQKKDAKVRREEKKKREGIKVKAGVKAVAGTGERIRPVGGKGGERMKQVEASEKELKKMDKAKEILEKPSSAEATEGEKKTTSKKIKKRSRGRNYQEAKKKIDKNKQYELKNAVALLKKIKFTKFDETVELHINVRENGVKGEVKLPHGTGKEIRVAIVDEKILAEVEKGNFKFDVLITHPSFMPKLVRFAKILGPKGLMPNPKTGTISEKPEEAAKKFKSGSIRFKTETKFPIIHQIVGKLSFKDEALVENITAFLNAIGKSKVESVFLKSSMSPAIRLDVEKI